VVLAAAQAATGLSDFGSPDFRERLDVWLKSFDEDQELGPLGRAGQFGECVRYASTRLRLEDLIKRHPEIEQIEIDRPIMIAGLPRSGTTHLLNIMAVDPRLRSTPLWETSEPMPGPDDVGDPDPRYLRTKAMWSAFEALLPFMPAMHEMAPDHVHEDIDLQGPDFSSYLPEWLSRPYRWQDYYFAHDQTPHYAYAKRVMQAMTWSRSSPIIGWIGSSACYAPASAIVICFPSTGRSIFSSTNICPIRRARSPGCSRWRISR
jgi:hypothetical protein